METPKITMAELQGKDGDELKKIVLDLAEQVRERDRLIAELRELVDGLSQPSFGPHIIIFGSNTVSSSPMKAT